MKTVFLKMFPLPSLQASLEAKIFLKYTLNHLTPMLKIISGF